MFVGTKAQPLTKVSLFDECTTLVGITFSPDGAVEAFPIPNWGIQTMGEPLDDYVAHTMASGSNEGLPLIEMLSTVSEVDLLKSMPTEYEE